MKRIDRVRQRIADFAAKHRVINGRLTIDGREQLDPTPVAIPIGFRQPESLEQRMMRMFRVQMSQYAQSKGLETFEEADDFDVDDDDFDPSTPYERDFDLAAVQASDKGIVAPPTDEYKLANDRIKDKYTLKSGRVFKRKDFKEERPLSQEERKEGLSPSVDSRVSKEGDKPSAAPPTPPRGYRLVPEGDNK